MKKKKAAALRALDHLYLFYFFVISFKILRMKFRVFTRILFLLLGWEGFLLNN